MDSTLLTPSRAKPNTFSGENPENLLCFSVDGELWEVLLIVPKKKLFIFIVKYEISRMYSNI